MSQDLTPVLLNAAAPKVTTTAKQLLSIAADTHGATATTQDKPHTVNKTQRITHPRKTQNNNNLPPVTKTQ